jgi:excisionase family DNA binding protein
MGKQEDRPTKRLFTVKEAAQYIAVSTWTMRELGWAGKVPFVKFNRLVYFDLEDLDTFIERNKFTENR